MSEKDIELLYNGVAAIESKLVIYNKDDYANAITVTNYDSIKSWKYNDERYVKKYGIIGMFVARELTGELQNISDYFSIQDKYIDLYLGIKDMDTDTTTYYNMGTFITEKPNDDEVADNTKFTAYDFTTLFNIPFDGDYNR